MISVWPPDRWTMPKSLTLCAWEASLPLQYACDHRQSFLHSACNCWRVLIHSAFNDLGLIWTSRWQLSELKIDFISHLPVPIYRCVSDGYHFCGSGHFKIFSVGVFSDTMSVACFKPSIRINDHWTLHFHASFCDLDHVSRWKQQQKHKT